MHRLTALLFLVAIAVEPARSQDTRLVSGGNILNPGGELENYLRYLQTTGAVPVRTWAIRGFSLRQTASLFPTRPHPWDKRFVSKPGGEPYAARIILPSTVSVWGNSGFPYGVNDGAVWAGKGITSSLSGGVAAHIGPIFIQANPLAFWSQNASFPLAPNGQTGSLAFGAVEPEHVTSVDYPQRFGNSPYSQIDPGESLIDVDLRWIRLGGSTAHEAWGPATEYPFLLGLNAAGFPHGFVATGDPLNLGIGTLEAKVIYGVLSQSAYSPVSGSTSYFSVAEPGTRRFASGIIATFAPRGTNGLELGVSRFFHSLWPQSGLPRSYFTEPFEGLLKTSLPERNSKGPADLSGSGNQLLSVFARWVLPHSGAEFYTEYGREDHAYDFRDLINEPDHSRSYLLGARKVLSTGDGSLSAFRAEIINFQLPTTARHRDEGGIYLHALLKQGHTQRGQLLGAPVGVGAAAGSTLAYDRFAPDGRWTFKWTRTVNREAGRFYRTGVQSQSAMDVSHALGVERLQFRGPFDLTLGATMVREFNRNFSGDALNLNGYVSVRAYTR
jgi:hypothetical protein